MYERKSEFRQPPPPLFIGQAQGVEDTWKYQNALKGGFPKKLPNSVSTIHENIFPRPLNPKIFL
jgi:hypothetical protein